MPVGFRGPVLEGAGAGRVQVVGAVEEGFGALGVEGWGGSGVGEGLGEGGRWWVGGVGYFHCFWSVVLALICGGVGR